MSKPDNAEAQLANTELTSDVGAATTAEATEPTFEQQVNSVVKQLKENEKGVWELPSDLEVSPEVRYAAMIEKRRRDTESALGKTRQQLKAEEVARKELEKRVKEQVKLSLTPEQAEELDDLMTNDPEAWRKKMNELEQQATSKLQEDLTAITSEATKQAELERRAQVLQQFNAEHSDAPITDEVLKNDIPPRIVNKLENGQISFEEFLAESYEFLTATKVIKTEPTPSVTNIGLAGGGDTPSKDAQEHQELDDYSRAVF